MKKSWEYLGVFVCVYCLETIAMLLLLLIGIATDACNIKNKQI